MSAAACMAGITSWPRRIASSISTSRSNAFASDLERGRGVTAPERDLGPDHGQVDGELGVLDVARLVAGELEMAAGGREVPGPQERDGRM